MAKRISQVQRVMNTDVQKLEAMTRAELAHEVSILASAANKRLRRLEKAGFGDTGGPTPAYAYTMRQGGNFSVKGKTKDQLLNELKRAKGFLGAKTSSVRGANRSVKETNAFLAKMETNKLKQKAIEKGKDPDEVEPVRYEMTKEEIAEYWKAVDRLREMPGVSFNDVCLLYTGRIEKYIESGRSYKQSANYVKMAMDYAEKKAKQAISDAEEEALKYGALGGNELERNNL